MAILTIIRPDATEYVDTAGEYLDIVDPAEGRIAFTLPPSLTNQVGMHFCSVSIYANGIKLATARFNYYVQGELSDGSGMIGENEYPVMQKLLAQMALIVDAEQMRAEAEYLRVLQENQRVDETSGIVAKASASAKTAEGYAAAADHSERGKCRHLEGHSGGRQGTAKDRGSACGYIQSCPAAKCPGRRDPERIQQGPPAGAAQGERAQTRCSRHLSLALSC